MNRPNKRLAPGPRGRPVVGSLMEFRRDVLGLLLHCQRTFGDIVRIRLGPVLVHLISHPRHIERVLKDVEGFDKATLSSQIIGRLTGDSLLVTNGEPWRRQRKLMQPAFSPTNSERYVKVIAELTSQMLLGWQSLAERGESLDVASEMMRLTYRVIEKVLFSTSSPEDLSQIEAAITVALTHTYRKIQSGGVPPGWLPTPGNLEFARALRVLDQRVMEIVKHRRDLDSNDLLSMLSAARGEDGQRMSHEQLRNETIALLIAGHETTANAVTWLWYLLSQHTEVANAVAEEVDHVLGQRAPTADDIPRLELTTRALLEAMRLYTPIWSLIRRVVVDTEIGGFSFPRDSRVVISPYVTHRHPDFWPKAESFDPSRFEPNRSKHRDHYAYIPFGGGPRICIGQHLAKIEGIVIVAMVIQKFRMTLLPGHPVEPQPGVTLRAKHGLRMVLH